MIVLHVDGVWGSMRNHVIFVVLTFGLLATASISSANDHPNLNANAIREQQTQIRSDAEARKGRYKDLSEAKRTELFARQDKVSALLKDVQITTELKERDQIELFNALESIQAIVNAAEDNRLICERKRPVGTNRTQTVCRTVAQRRAERESIERDTGRRTIECSEATMGLGGCQN